MPVNLNKKEQKQIQQAVIASFEAGYEVADAAKLLSQHIAFPKKVREEFLRYSQPQEASASWMKAIQKVIENKSPFCLEYPKPNGEISQHIVRYAHIEVIEHHSYLAAWVEKESDDSFIELRHNRFFRLDRMQNAVVSPVSGSWREGLGEIEVTFDTFRGLAHHYNPKSSDCGDNWVGLSPPQRRITRNISSTLWFLRDFRVYGSQAKLLGPNVLIDILVDELKDSIEMYKS